MGKVIKAHQPCPDCSSSDALAVYEDGTYCFSCQRRRGTVAVYGNEEKEISKISEDSTGKMNVGALTSIRDRGIDKEVCRTYSVTTDSTKHYYPYFNKDGVHVANKVRNYATKQFKVEGDITDSQLFGQQLFKSGGKYITLVEGELDALSAYQIFRCKWPVVSIKTGVTGSCKDVEQNYEYLMSFENIVIAFDNDEQGKKYAKKVAELLSPKAKIMRMRYKDANEYLTNQCSEDFEADWWNAEVYAPDGIVAGASLWDTLIEGPVKSEVAYPFKGINKMTYGIRKGELVTVCAGTGIGKSSFLREIIYHIFKKTSDNIGLMFMEENVRTTAESIMSIHLNKLLHLPDCDYTEEEYKNAFDKTMGTDRFYFFDHFGSNTIENIISRIRYLVRALGCRYIVLDHISILVSAQDSVLDERKTIDACITKLRTLVQELGISLFLVSHLRRPSTGSHETGSVNVSLSDLRGSHSIGQLSDIVIGLERNGQADCVIERHTTYVRVIKNRFSGLTGLCTKLHYDFSIGRITEAPLIDDEFVDEL